jgi:glycerol-3-phosphate dehydrogenase
MVLERWPFLADEELCDRLVAAYGNRLARVLGDARQFVDLGQNFGHGLTEAEVRYLIRHEWAESADDVLWRRTKLGLKFSADEKDALAQFMTTLKAV